MAEIQVMIPSGDISLESSFEERPGRDAGVLLHPHPLYGGDMENNVVVTVKQGMNEKGWSTLRYNSRGVGKSGGSYDHGEGESRDLLHVVEHLREKLPGSRVHVAAYSFGAWVALKAIVEKDCTPESLLLVSPPVDFVSFEGLSLPSVPCLVIAGDMDDLCSPGSLKTWMKRALEDNEHAHLQFIGRCDHFFRGRESELLELVRQFAGKGSDRQ